MAKYQEVLLIQNVLKLGDMGEIVRVKPGYARNHLLPQSKAIPAARAHKKQIEALRERAKVLDQEAMGKAQSIRKSLDGLTIQIPAKVAHDITLFGSVGTREILQALAQSGIALDSRQVHLHEHYKKLGRYPVVIKLHREVSATITVEVVNSDPNGMSLDEALALAQSSAEAARLAREEKKAKPAEGADEAAATAGETAAAPAEAAKPAKEKGKKDKAAEKPAADAPKAEKPEKAEKKAKADKKAKG